MVKVCKNLPAAHKSVSLVRSEMTGVLHVAHGYVIPSEQMSGSRQLNHSSLVYQQQTKTKR